MANKQDIITAVNNLDIFLRIPELKGSSVKKNKIGSPFFYTGGFNMVFQIEKESKKWAFRVWHVNIKNQRTRCHKISKFLTTQNLPFFADFIYDEKGLLVNGEYVDTIRMEWLDGLLLKEYIISHQNNKNKLLQLAESFLKMCKELHKHRISHGDLQHGNIIIDNEDKIKLIDYDSICIPDIEGQDQSIKGLKGYQHPSRFNSKNTTTLKADYFSELIIYLCIIAIAQNPKLANKYNVLESDSLLFEPNDFSDLENSKIFSDLRDLEEQIPSLLSVLKYYLLLPTIDDLEPFYEVLKSNRKLTTPTILSVSASKYNIYENEKVKLEWKVIDADLCYLSEYGDVTDMSSCELRITKRDYKLIAINNLGKVEETLKFKFKEKPICVNANLRKIAILITTLGFLLWLTYSQFIAPYRSIESNPPTTFEISDLIGYYSAEQTLGDLHQNASAQIRETNGNLTLLFSIPNYPPQVIQLKVDIDNFKLTTDHLGKGDIVLHQQTDEIEIIFNNESYIWVLRK